MNQRCKELTVNLSPDLLESTWSAAGAMVPVFLRGGLDCREINKVVKRPWKPTLWHQKGSVFQLNRGSTQQELDRSRQTQYRDSHAAIGQTFDLMFLRSIHCASTQILQKLRSAHPGRVARAGQFRVLSGCRLPWQVKKLKTNESNHRWSNGLHMSAYVWTLVSLLHSHTFPHRAFQDHAGVLWWQRQLKRSCKFSSSGREHHAVLTSSNTKKLSNSTHSREVITMSDPHHFWNLVNLGIVEIVQRKCWNQKDPTYSMNNRLSTLGATWRRYGGDLASRTSLFSICLFFATSSANKVVHLHISSQPIPSTTATVQLNEI